MCARWGKLMAGSMVTSRGRVHMIACGWRRRWRMVGRQLWMMSHLWRMMARLGKGMTSCGGGRQRMAARGQWVVCRVVLFEQRSTAVQLGRSVRMVCRAMPHVGICAQRGSMVTWWNICRVVGTVARMVGRTSSPSSNASTDWSSSQVWVAGGICWWWRYLE